MNNHEEPDREIPTGRFKLFEAVTPSAEDLARAANIPPDQCPRQYCWWWRSLTFDWDLTPEEGCKSE